MQPFSLSLLKFIEQRVKVQSLGNAQPKSPMTALLLKQRFQNSMQKCFYLVTLPKMGCGGQDEASPSTFDRGARPGKR